MFVFNPTSSASSSYSWLCIYCSLLLLLSFHHLLALSLLISQIAVSFVLISMLFLFHSFHLTLAVPAVSHTNKTVPHSFLLPCSLSISASTIRTFCICWGTRTAQLVRLPKTEIEYGSFSHIITHCLLVFAPLIVHAVLQFALVACTLVIIIPVTPCLVSLHLLLLLQHGN